MEKAMAELKRQNAKFKESFFSNQKEFQAKESEYKTEIARKNAEIEKLKTKANLAEEQLREKLQEKSDLEEKFRKQAETISEKNRILTGNLREKNILLEQLRQKIAEMEKAESEYSKPESGKKKKDEIKSRKPRKKFKCSECGGIVFEDDKKCPHCGASFD